MKAVFLDRDGTLIVDPPDLRVDAVEKIKLFPDTIAALKILSKLDYKVFIISNQAGIAEGRISMQDFEFINSKVIEQLAPSGMHIEKTYVCPHDDRENCTCRKPKPGMLLQAAEEYGIDLTDSWMIGDRHTDMQAGHRAGVKTVLVLTGNLPIQSEEADYTADSLEDAISYIAT